VPARLAAHRAGPGRPGGGPDRRPADRRGWLLLGAALWIPLTVAASEYAALVYDYGHRGPPGLGPVAVALSGLFTFVIVVFPLVTLVFPDGRLPSPGWRWVVYA
jgi:hypothetical protein